MTNNTVAHSEIDALIAGIRTCRDEAINEPATARAEIAALRAQVERLTTVTEEGVDRVAQQVAGLDGRPFERFRDFLFSQRRALIRAALMTHTARGE